MDERNNHFDFDFMPIGQTIKKAREARGMTEPFHTIESRQTTYLLVLFKRAGCRKASQGSPADFFVQHGGWMSSPSKKPAPQSHMASSTGMMLRPNGVREYRVLGGLSGMTSRCSIPHSSRSCNCCDSILGVAFGIMRCSSM